MEAIDWEALKVLRERWGYIRKYTPSIFSRVMKRVNEPQKPIEYNYYIDNLLAHHGIAPLPVAAGRRGSSLTADMKKLLITTALCVSILPANADPQTQDADAELVCDTMGMKVMDRYEVSAEHLADANETRKLFADGCKKLFLLFKDGVITKDQLDTALGDVFKGYVKTFDDVLPRKRSRQWDEESEAGGRDGTQY